MTLMNIDDIKAVNKVVDAMSAEEREELTDEWIASGWDYATEDVLERSLQLADDIKGYVLKIPNFDYPKLPLANLSEDSNPRIYKLWQITGGAPEDKPGVLNDAPVWPWSFHGYVKFDKRPVTFTGHRGILAYVPGYQGLTFSRQFEDGYVYGFSTGVGPAVWRPSLRDPNMIERHVRDAAKSIQVAATYEEPYNLAQTYELRWKIVEMMTEELLEVGVDPSVPAGLDAMINCITGKY